MLNYVVTHSRGYSICCGCFRFHLRPSGHLRLNELTFDVESSFLVYRAEIDFDLICVFLEYPSAFLLIDPPCPERSRPAARSFRARELATSPQLRVRFEPRLQRVKPMVQAHLLCPLFHGARRQPSSSTMSTCRCATLPAPCARYSVTPGEPRARCMKHRARSSDHERRHVSPCGLAFTSRHSSALSPRSMRNCGRGTRTAFLGARASSSRRARRSSRRSCEARAASA